MVDKPGLTNFLNGINNAFGWLKIFASPEFQQLQALVKQNWDIFLQIIDLCGQIWTKYLTPQIGNK